MISYIIVATCNYNLCRTPKPKRSLVLKVISSVSKKFKAEKPESADCNGDDKDDEVRDST